MPIYKTKIKNKAGQVRYIVRVNYTDSTGAYRQLSRTAYGLQEAKVLERELQRSPEQSAAVVPAGFSMDDLYKEYERSVSGDLRRSTLRNNEKIYRLHIKPYIGSVVLSRLNVRHLNDWKVQLNKTDLALATKRNAYTVLRLLLNFAVKMEYIQISPLNKITNFKDSSVIKKEMQFYTAEQWLLYRDAMLAEAQRTGNYNFYVFFYIRYYTGLRKGEINALHWSCVTDTTISVERSVTQKLKGGDVETAPKNASSVRVVQIPSVLSSVLAEHKARQQTAIPGWSDEGYVCGYFRPLRDTSIANANNMYADLAGLPHIRVHDFRHSARSFLLNNGIARMEVRHRLGHSTIEQTVGTYAHLFTSEGDRAVAALDKIEKEDNKKSPE